MPRATADTTSTEHFDLKSLEGGFVELRRLDYGQMMRRQEMAADMVMKSDQGSRRARNNTEAIVKMMQTVVTEFEFAHCVVDHNLEDESGNKLNFTMKGTVSLLDPRIGQEISELIDDMNQFQADTEDLVEGSEPQSS